MLRHPRRPRQPDHALNRPSQRLRHRFGGIRLLRLAHAVDPVVPVNGANVITFSAVGTVRVMSAGAVVPQVMLAGSLLEMPCMTVSLSEVAAEQAGWVPRMP